MAGSGTFSESWYRVAGLRPRLRAAVRVHRQHFRGRLWHVASDPANNQFFRLHEAAWRFVAMLDGTRTVSRAWQACNERLGDEALTQNEGIEVLGQLYAANLLAGELPPDTEGLFQRYRKRKGREIRGQLANLLFLRVPLVDPDALLDRLVGVAGLAFTPVGFVLWLGLLAAGAYALASRAGELVGQAESMLNARRLAENLPLLYAAFVLAKVFHEFGHALACKKFGRQTHSGGEVHVMGIMLLVFVPMPYVDATSAWAFRGKLHRTVVGAAGMMVELALAAVAAMVWSATAGSGDPWTQAVHATAYSLIFAAGVSTLLFNSNPLLRFDGYYILSDLLEIPNLGDRSRQHIGYLVRRWGWGVRGAIRPAQSAGEAAWLLGYGVASTAFRVFLCVKILLLLAERFFLIGSVLAVAAAVTWLLLPLGRFLRYLLTSPELGRSRLRAIGSTLAVVAAAGAGLGMLDAPDRHRVEGVVEPVRLTRVYAEADGLVRSVLPSCRLVSAGDAGSAAAPLMTAVNREMEVERDGLIQERQVLEARQRIARQRSAADPRYLALLQILDRDMDDLARQSAMVDKELASLSVLPPAGGTWICDRAERLAGTYVRKGTQIGVVASLGNLRIRAPAGQQLAGMLIAERSSEVEIRLPGRPGEAMGGLIERILPASRRPAAPAGAAAEPGPVVAAGQPVSPDAAGEEGERLFDVHITPCRTDGFHLLPGQPVVVQFRMRSRPLLAQWWRSLRQLAQRRLGL